MSAPPRPRTRHSSSDVSELLRGPGVSLLNERLPGYLVQQRWFGGKSRALGSATIGSVIPLANGAFALTTVDVAYTDGSTEVYQLPLAVASGTAAETLRTAKPLSILINLSNDEAGSLVYDASQSEEFRKLLLAFINPALATPELAATISPAADLTPLAQQSSRVGSAEQSNTSILFGQSAILKLFRRLQPGENPDVEICRFLTDVAHFKHIPAYLGELHSQSDGATLAFLQAFIPNDGDGSAWFERELNRFYDSVDSLPEPPSTGTRAVFGAPPVLPPEGREHAAPSLQAAAKLGRLTADMHLALAIPTDQPAFQAVPFTVADLESDQDRLFKQAQRALSTLSRALSALPGAVQASTQALLTHAAQLTSPIALPPKHTGLGQRIRIHGDYHLGQTLHSGDDFVPVDFEGEPAKPLEERRSKQSPLRDVAGMLRSFSYAVLIAFKRRSSSQPETATALRAWAALWENAVCAQFLTEYAATIRHHKDLLPDNETAQRLLEKYLLEKALYEVVYELDNRQDWVSIPLDGLLALLRPGASLSV